MKGENIFLRPARPEERGMIYQWMAQSDLTSSMMGPPDFPEISIPTFEQFTEDYQDYFFDGSDPHAGRSYIIMEADNALGHINYNTIYPDGSVELDIWIASSEYTSAGHGTEAILILCDYLATAWGATRIYLAPSLRNQRAIRSYHKAGFEPTVDIPSWFVPDYHDALVLCKEISRNP
jgi:diamine N-acetyltransferase